MDLSKVVVMDTEVYPNYFLISFKKISNGQVLWFDKFNDSEFNIRSVLHIMQKYTVVTFNGNKYDSVMVEAAISGFSNANLYRINCYLIEEGLQPWQVRKKGGFPQLKFDHIDLLEVAPLKASLKIYGGRLHAPKMQDLPIEPGTTITEQMRQDLISYCGNDLDLTELILNFLTPEIELREDMSEEYGTDLRSKSDAQIAEAVIKRALDDDYDIRPKRPKIEAGTVYYYKPPANLQFKTKQLQDLLEKYTTLPFRVGKGGHVELPPELKNYKFEIGGVPYKVGVGGIHSIEKKRRLVSDDTRQLRDYDVASFYPRIILNNNLYPRHIGKPFLKVYDQIVERRLKAKRLQKEAKKAGDKKAEKANKVINESLKITINGSFGKFGSKWSCLYSPDLMMQVTITGQLSLLMLVEQLALKGIETVSANTDGIVVSVRRDGKYEELCEEIIEEWEFETEYELEAADYLSLNSRDVNAYIAVKENSCKGKGSPFADQYEHYYKLRSNPTNEICKKAVKLFLQKQIPVEKTIREHKDPRDFITIRTVNGGAVYEGELIGKAIRWYYAKDELDAIYYRTNGNRVNRTMGAKPLMELPEQLPSDLDYDWYIQEANKLLKEVGYKI